jgi:hypothetical protein
MANDLDLTLITSGTANNQYQASNDGLTELANAVQDILLVDFSAGNVTLTSDQFRSAITFKPDAALAASRNLTIAAVKRGQFIVHNPDTTYTISVIKGSTTIAVGPGEVGVFYSDGTTNSLEGTVVAAGASGSTVGKQTIWIPASAMAPATTAGCAALGQLETSSNKVNYPVLAFDATADEHAHFNVAFPKSWNLGTLTFRVKWSSIATDTDGVAWGLQAVAISDNEAIDATWGTAIVVTDDAQSAAGELYVTAESAALTVGGTPAANDLVFFRIFRDVSDANDDMTEDARLIGVTIYYTSNAGTDD